MTLPSLPSMEPDAIKKERPITSASNLYRRKLCPGSARLEAQAPKEEESQDASRGTLLHAVRAGIKSADGLSPKEIETVNFCKDERVRFFEEIFTNDAPSIQEEVTLYFDGKEFGHADTIAFHEELGVIVDDKFGFIEVPQAETNLQIRAYAVMAADMLGLKEVFGKIIQPWVKKEKHENPVKYVESDIEQAREEIRDILTKSEKPDAPLNPSEEACRYCKAKGICPAINQEAKTLAKIAPNQITVQNAAEIFRKSLLVEKHIGALKQHIYFMVKEAFEMGEEIPGITMKLGTKRRTITDASKAYSTLKQFLLPEDFAACCKVAIGDLDAAYKAASGLSGKDAKAKLESLLTQAGCLEFKQSEPTLTLA